jgi:hypothetical protein
LGTFITHSTDQAAGDEIFSVVFLDFANGNKQFLLMAFAFFDKVFIAVSFYVNLCLTSLSLYSNGQTTVSLFVDIKSGSQSLI